MELEQLNTRIPKELKKELKKIALREDKDLEDIITEELSKFVKEHGEGNPSNTILRWVENPKFKSFPAFMRKREDWEDYIQNHTDTKEQQEIIYQAQSILTFAQKKLKYNDTKVRTF